jgi:hypothetical protein
LAVKGPDVTTEEQFGKAQRQHLDAYHSTSARHLLFGLAVSFLVMLAVASMSGCALWAGTPGPSYPTQLITVRLPAGTTGSVQVERINPTVNVTANTYLTSGRVSLAAVRHVDAMPSRAPARTGIVQIDRRALRDDQGPLHGLGLTFFWAYQGETTERDRFLANLDWLTDPAFPFRRPDYLRILAQVDWQGRDINPNDPNYEANLGKTIDDIYAHGMRVEISIIGGPLSRADAVSLAQKVARVLVGRAHKVIDLEMANEWSAGDKTDIDTMVAMVGVFKASSGVRVIGLSSNFEPRFVDGLRRAGGTLLTDHSDRDPGRSSGARSARCATARRARRRHER